MKYRVTQKLSDQLYGIMTPHGPQLFSLRTLRKETKCAVTKRTLRAGTQHYGPLASTQDRYVRLHRVYVEGSWAMGEQWLRNFVSFVASPKGIAATKKLLEECNPSAFNFGPDSIVKSTVSIKVKK